MLEKSLKFTIFCRTNTVNGDLNQYKIVVPLFGAAYAYAAKIKAQQFYTNFPILTCLLSQSNILE